MLGTAWTTLCSTEGCEVLTPSWTLNSKYFSWNCDAVLRHLMICYQTCDCIDVHGVSLFTSIGISHSSANFIFEIRSKIAKYLSHWAFTWSAHDGLTCAASNLSTSFWCDKQIFLSWFIFEICSRTSPPLLPQASCCCISSSTIFNHLANALSFAITRSSRFFTFFSLILHRLI